MKYDKINETVGFMEGPHEYRDLKDNAKYISVTTLVNQFCQPYDEIFWSFYKALEKILKTEEFKSIKMSLLNSKKVNEEILSSFNIDIVEFEKTKTSIIEEWHKNRDESCARGTAIHLEKELSYYKNPTQKSPYYELGGKFECKKDYCKLDLERGIYPEFLISRRTADGILRIAGQLDLLIKDENDIYIVDFKSNKKLDDKSYFDPKTKKYQMMKFPLNNLMDCHMMHYTMQLSLYAFLLQLNNPEFNIKSLKIIHFDHSGKETHHELEYKKDDVERLLKFYKKDCVLKERKDKRKPIEY